MPGKNRPKRLNRNISWRVARRKKKKADLVSGGGRNRKPRPKNKKAVVGTNPVEKPVVKKVVKKVSKKAEKEE